MLRVILINPVERLVDSQIETENQRLLITHTMYNRQP